MLIFFHSTFSYLPPSPTAKFSVFLFPTEILPSDLPQYDTLRRLSIRSVDILDIEYLPTGLTHLSFRGNGNAHLIANLATELEAGRALTYHCADMLNNGENAIKEVSMSKLYTGELTCRVMDRCLQLLGGYGYVEEYHMAKAFRDSRLITIGGGTSEVMREIIAGMVLA